MHRLLRAAVAALAIAMSAPAAALADQNHDFAGSRTPAAAKQRASAQSVRAHRAYFEGRLIGPDASGYNGCSIDWRAVAQVRAFAFVKATEGTTWNDPCFATNWQALAAAHLIHGAYHFARPHAPVSSARDEANHFVSVVRAAGGFRRTLPPVLDVEASRGLTQQGLRAWIQTWVDTVRAQVHRYRVTIYTGSWFWNPMVGPWAPRGALLWASGYSTTMPQVAGFGSPNWWQYTDGQYGPTPHSSPGLGAADHSVWLGTKRRLRRLAGRR